MAMDVPHGEWHGERQQGQGHREGEAAGPRFGAVLRGYRQRAGLTQEALAERAGLSARGIQDLERGLHRAPQGATVALLAAALGLDAPEHRRLEAAAPRQRGVPPPDRSRREEGAARLPAPLTALLGRAGEVAVVDGLLRRPGVRLLTLTGPGGVGKTRLAIQVATEAAGRYADGVWWVDLAPLGEPGLVWTTVAQELGLRLEGDEPPLGRLIAALLRARLLLVLDNFEHVLPAATGLAELLGACTGVQALVTSRARLRAQGERRYAVPPLALPAPEAVLDVASLGVVAAVALFVARAGEGESAFALATTNAEAVAEVCRRLDGLPLAIELAAARVVLFPPAALLSRLERSMDLLTGGRQDAPARQRTLRATLAWSHDLLNAGERALFRRLAVFVGGATVGAVEAVCAAGEGSGDDVLECLAGLVDKSLLRVEEQPDGEPRLGMLETVRAYGLEQLTTHGEDEEVRERHATWVLELAARARVELMGSQAGAWSVRMEAEHDNVRAALGWAVERGEAAIALRLGADLWRFWQIRGHVGEGRRWLEAVLALPGGDRAARAIALEGAAVLADLQHADDRAAALFEQSVALRQDLGDRGGRAVLQGYLGDVATRRGAYARAVNLDAESVAGARAAGDWWTLAFRLAQLGAARLDQGDVDGAVGAYKESRALFQDRGHDWGVALALDGLGDVARFRRQYEHAAALYEASLALRGSLGDRGGIAAALYRCGAVARTQGELGRAGALFAESVALFEAVGDSGRIAIGLAGLAGVAAAQGQYAQAARLFGAAAELHKRTATVAPPLDRTVHDVDAQVSRVSLGDDVFAAEWTRGRSLPLDGIIAAARAAFADDLSDGTPCWLSPRG
jgi:predicted ATPase/transcriptional regulator with XRE-family HTH domain